MTAMFTPIIRGAAHPLVPMVRAYAERRTAQLLAGADQQRRALAAILAMHAESDFGREHGFARLRGADDFRSAVPLGDHATLKPYLDRVVQGEPRALLGPAAKLIGFTTSSGTTGRRKLIPMTAAGVEALQRSWLWWGAFMYTDHPEIIGSPLAQLASDWGGERSPAGLPCGDVSGLMARLAPWYVRWAYSVPYETAQIRDDALRYQAYVRLAVAEPGVRCVATATPATLVRLAELADASKEQLLRDLADGTLNGAAPAAAGVPLRVAALLGRRRVARVRELERRLAGGPLTPQIYWPRLALVATWTAGTFGHYTERLRGLYGKAALRDIGLMASEGHFTVPLRDESAVGTLNAAPHFFEFRAGASAETRLAHELEVGQSYSLVVTTLNGLYRYDMEDLVRCAGYDGVTPRLEFLAKAAHISDLTGEKLSAHQVAEAFRAVERRAGGPLPAMLLKAVRGAPPGYELHFEIGDAAPDGLLGARLTAAVDAALRDINYIYKEHQDSGKLAPLAGRAVPKGGLAAPPGPAEQAKPRLLVGIGPESFPPLPASS